MQDSNFSRFTADDTQDPETAVLRVCQYCQSRQTAGGENEWRWQVGGLEQEGRGVVTLPIQVVGVRGGLKGL